jgi:hypothetical protein
VSESDETDREADIHASRRIYMQAGMQASNHADMQKYIDRNHRKIDRNLRQEKLRYRERVSEVSEVSE